MLSRFAALAITVLAAPVTFGQAPSEPGVVRVLRFTRTDTVQGFQEIATVIRTIADVRQLTVDTAPRALALRGTADQIALAQWLFIELDVRAGGQSPSARSQSSGTHEYRVPSTSDDVTRVFFLSQTDTARGIQAIAVAIRTVAEIQRLFICTAPRALALRGTASQIGLAEWLIKKLDKPADGQPPARQNQDAPTEEYRMPGSSEIVRVIYTAHTDTAQDSQQIVTAIRVIGEIQRILLCPEQKALALRGTADQIALAGWLFNELDKPATEQPIAQESPGVHDYRVPANGDEVRGVHVSDARTAQSVQ